MATTKKNVITEELVDMEDQLTMETPEPTGEYKGPTCMVMLPELPDSGSGMKVDQYEHVTIANEEKETHYRVRRGEWVEVPVPVYLALKQGRYPKI